jgi:elongation factor 1-gamma
VNSELLPCLTRANGHLKPLNPIPYNKSAIQQAETELENIYPVLEAILKEKTYLVGERITAADILLALLILRNSGWVSRDSGALI